jgi:hypothetical protein
MHLMTWWFVISTFSPHSNNKMPNIEHLCYGFSIFFFEHIIFCKFIFIIYFTFFSNFLFFICTFPLCTFPTYSAMLISFWWFHFSFQSKLDFPFELTPSLFNKILPTMNENFFFKCQNKIFLIYCVKINLNIYNIYMQCAKKIHNANVQGNAV